jgi:gliding motility-associated lipoprotein GldD
LLLLSCEEPVYTPKPRGYPKIEYPEKTYQTFNESYCSDFTFEYPTYAEVQQDTTYFDKKPDHPCWFDLYFPMYDSRVHFSYRPVDKKQNKLETLKGQAFALANKHNVRADYIDELPVNKSNGVSGMIFDIQGAAASPFQFYLTNKDEHFLRGALYFNTQARPDSLAPLYDFLKVDMMHLIETFEWQE